MHARQPPGDICVPVLGCGSAVLTPSIQLCQLLEHSGFLPAVCYAALLSLSAICSPGQGC